VKKAGLFSLAGIAAFVIIVSVAIPGSAAGSNLAVKTSTRWPTVTWRPTDTRWSARPTNTNTRLPAHSSSTRWPTVTRYVTSTHWPTSPARPTSTRWPTHGPSPTRTILPSPTFLFSATPTFTLSPTITSTETPTPGDTPTATATPLPFSEGPITIGYSVQGRPLEVYRFGTGPTERLIIAGIHGGNEYNTVRLADQLMAQIKSDPTLIPSDITLYILRLLNPDGAAKALNADGRANANGVDLNRNWPVNWKKDWPRAGCWTTTPTTGGTGPASEPETQALMAFIQAHHFDALIDYHSAALGIFNGGIPDFPPSDSLAAAVAAVTTYSYPPVNTGCVYTGGLIDWTSAQGIASLDVELTDHTHTDFNMNLNVLKVFVAWKP
jgi:predicted deacylase